MTSYVEHDSPLGTLVLAASDKGLRGVYFEQHRYFSGTQGWRCDPGHARLDAARRQLDDYFAGRRKRFDLALDLAGTPFQQAVWQALLGLDFGEQSTYARIAAQIGRPSAVRAAGTAIGRNPVSIIVPCHRVLGSTGGLSGYAGGLERKRFLLALEGVSCGE
ncbi:methylated-DNA--[protein]-cysteine S-methyltransferase [Noviherbaspirillum galbum]|uniref:Methylated-DNA--protein-cysteine methyltransferase n=1 Tax=Noviherbaspirillum galbum TaxID=2709383 RepID=A0A6B3STK5_9BURK|nr:methylated-DNA--[protein]-cysteine S-methyltransferase [Noviherbaspirillum galbum]NEX63818.1 methylated-DNA--[protein]-cysteine S-methyltransferase [Noviherbaspirillum galbum]